MTWFVNLNSTVALDSSEAETEEEAIEVARQTIMEWLDQEDGLRVSLDWEVEQED